MTTKRADRFAAAAALSTGPEPADLTRGTMRTEPVRITVDLQPDVYTGLHRWLGEAAEVGQPKLTLSDVVRALVGKLIEDQELGADIRDRAREAKR